MKLRWLIAALPTLSACAMHRYDGGAHWAELGHACPSDAPAFSAPTSYPLPHAPDVERTSIRLARTVPGGFGGIYLQGETTTALLVDTTKGSEATPAIAAVYQREIQRVAPARWTYAQLYDWKTYIISNVSRSVVPPSIAISEQQNRIDISAPDERSSKALETWLATLNLPCRLVSLSIQPPETDF